MAFNFDKTPSPSHTLFSILCALVCFPGILQGCMLDFNADDKTLCLSDADCIDGRVCVIPEPVPGEDGPVVFEEGTCTTPNQDEDSTPSRCASFDADNDGTYTLETCGPLDCDDNDGRRSPLLPEFCDEIDNNCDGQIDEGLRNGCGTCGAVPEEVCNGLDDDCDGVIDNGVLNACGTCGAVPEEICDLQDNDCDGQVDEGLEGCLCTDEPPRACPESASVPTCAVGEQPCTNGRWQDCVGRVVGSLEVCNGLDDDCNGEVDEGFDLSTNLDHCGACGNSCRGPYAEGRCESGTCRLTCFPGHYDIDGDPSTGCEYACIPERDTDLCNDGVDNDCNGQIDDNCLQPVLGGRYAFYNLFGRGTEGRPPALIEGILEITDANRGQGKITNLVRYASNLEGGSVAYTRESERRIILESNGALSLLPQTGDDPAGGVFRGTLSQDPSRSLAAFIEYNDADQQIASIAFLVKLPDPRLTPGYDQIRGPYLIVEVSPERLLQSLPAVTARSWSMRASAPRGDGQETWTQRSEEAPVFSTGATLDYYSQEGSTLSVTLRDQNQAPTQHYRGSATPQGGAVISSISALSADQTTSTPDPSLALMVEQRNTPSLDALQGAWTLTGLQVLRRPESTDLTYNAVQETLLFAGGENGALQITIEGEEEPLQNSSVTLGASNSPGVEQEIQIRAYIPDNLNRPPLTLRGYLTQNGALLVLREVDDEGAPASSIFLATRRPAASFAIAP